MLSSRADPLGPLAPALGGEVAPWKRGLHAMSFGRERLQTPKRPRCIAAASRALRGSRGHTGASPASSGLGVRSSLQGPSSSHTGLRAGRGGGSSSRPGWLTEAWEATEHGWGPWTPQAPLHRSPSPSFPRRLLLLQTGSYKSASAPWVLLEINEVTHPWKEEGTVAAVANSPHTPSSCPVVTISRAGTGCLYGSVRRTWTPETAQDTGQACSPSTPCQCLLVCSFICSFIHSALGKYW